MSYSCIINIDNSANSFPLELQQEQSTISGNFSPGLPTTIAANESVTLTLTSEFLHLDAAATLAWTTGPSGAQATIEMVFENTAAGLENKAGLTVTGSPEAMLAYGVSYFYASSGAAAPMARDYINDIGDSPVYVNFYVVPQTSPTTFLPGITNVVMVMLENRSLDHLMGQLYTNTGGNSPAHIYGADDNPEFNGLGAVPAFSNTYNNGPVTASPVSGTLNITDPDPGEGWVNTNQEIFNITGTPPPGAIPNMGGFLANFAPYAAEANADPNQIMQFYTPDDLPVISALAKGYAVSDAWFCSVPSQTMPNRAFSIAGTSCGYVDNTVDGNPHSLIFTFYKMRTIFNLLSDCGNEDWAIFSPEFNDLFKHNPMTSYLFDQVGSLLYGDDIPLGTWPWEASDASSGQPAQNRSLDDFFYQCQNGTLPAFSYVEPAFYFDDFVPNFSIHQYINGTDYHPPANLCPGEAFLAAIYNALTGYKDWNSTLLIVTFDEHGGNFDHVVPPGTIAPDEMRDWSGFDFDRLGIRVPTLLISPMIQAGTVFRSPDSEVPFDHTSFVRTILGWQGIDISGGAMGARAVKAPDFSGVLQSSAVNIEAVTLTPNSICANIEDPLNPPGSTELNGLQKFLLPFVAHGISGHQPGTVEHQQTLEELQSIKTTGELKEYVEKSAGSGNKQ
jgi:phospholipase C